MPALSVSEAVGDAAEAAITELAITGVTVSRRKTPSVPEGSGALPQIVVSVGAEPATEYVTARLKIRKYPVAVTIVAAGGSKAADDPVVRGWRDQIDAALDTKTAWAAIAGFDQVDAGGGPVFDVSALSKDYNYSVQTFTVQVLEART